MFRTLSVTTALTISMLAALAAPACAVQNDGPFPNIKAAPLAAVWQYSNDGGKTFVDKPLPAPPPGGRGSNHPYAWKATFDVPDPSQIAGLWVRLVEEHPFPSTPRASICNGDLDEAAGGYWKDLGYHPCLLGASIVLNGKEAKFANGPVLYFWVPLEGELRRGQNALEMRGNVYSYWGGAFDDPPAKAVDAKLLAAPPQPATIYNGPILGDFGDGYFTFACRTQLPADLIVEATPTEPARPPVTTLSPKNIWHRVKVAIPKGTRKLTYRLAAKVGSHETKRGPWEVKFPGNDFRFAVFGNVMGHVYGIGPWTSSAAAISRAGLPDLFLNTGNLLEQETWEFNWEAYYLEPSGDLFARVPTLITPCDRDFSGVFNELHYTPAADGYAHTWSKVVGAVRFIGLDGNETWKKDNPRYKWLENELTNAKEKFVVVLDGYPGYSSGVNSKRRNSSLDQTRDVVLPLLGKHKATLMLCGWDPDYERCEPTPDKGATQIVTGCIGKAFAHRWSGRSASTRSGRGRKSPSAKWSTEDTNGAVGLPGRTTPPSR